LRPVGPPHAAAAVVTIGSDPVHPDRSARLRARIMRHLEAGEPAYRWDSEAGYVPDGWRVAPGVSPFWRLPTKIGGMTTNEAFYQAIERLLADGLVIEVWCQPTDGRTLAHQLVMPGHSAGLAHPVVKARGRPEVLASEPWGGSLMRSGSKPGRWRPGPGRGRG
jgi:hypothetical protein